MPTALTHYIDSVKYNLRLDSYKEQEFINELETHIEDELQELKATGLSEEEAANSCVRLLGSARLVAHRIYEAHSQGTWRQTLLAAIPHLLFGLLFLFNWWQNISWLLITLGLIAITVVYGWCHGKPTWLFPWLGYSLLPVVIASLSFLCLPKVWSWLAIILYIPLASWLLYSVSVQTMKSDWLYSALMLMPLPAIIGWFLAIHFKGRFLEFSLQYLHDFAPWIGMSFLALALAVVMFMRFRQRWLKVAVLFLAGLITLTMVAFYAGGVLGLLTFLILTLVMLEIFLAPALLEGKIRYSGHRTST